MFHTIYKITNLTNNKIYIGKHSSSSLKDDYMGSGKLIKMAIKKYGLENFKKEILFILESEKEAYEKEKEIITEVFINQVDVYNIIMGGDSFYGINSNIELRKEKNKRAALKMNSITWKDEEFVKRKKEESSKTAKRLYKEGIFKQYDWNGKKHKEETKKLIGEKNSITQKGEKNSQYGTCWITNNNNENMKIKKADLILYLDRGWVKGRKIK